MYLEISPRGSGKTYRLIKDAANFLQENPDKNIGVNAMSLRAAKSIQDKLFKLGHSREKILLNKILPIASKNYYDDFEWFESKSLPISIGMSDYYCTSIRKKRKYGQEREPFDFLLSLIEANKGKYVCFHNFYFADLELIERAKKDISKDHFDTEFLNHLFE